MSAIVFAWLLPLTFLVVQAGLYYHAKQRAAAAADHGAAAAAAAGGNEAAGEEAAAAFLADMPVGQNADLPVIEVDVNGDEVEVTVVADLDPMIDIGTWSVSATATAPVERFIPEPDR